jgi:hypothetical protein
VRLCQNGAAGAWFPWAYVGTDQIGDVARSAGLVLEETWTADGRWFAALACQQPAALPVVAFAPETVTAEEAVTGEAADAAVAAVAAPSGLHAEGRLAS